MVRSVRIAACACACAVAPAIAVAQTVLTLEETVARAREQAGPVAVARTRIAEGEADVIDASARLRDNPIIDGATGPRTGDTERTADVELGLPQQFETGGQRRARIAGARAIVERLRAEFDQAARGAVFEAATAFLDGLAATERLQVAEQGDRGARDLLNAIERRYALGDVAAIDVNLARVDAARSAATLVSARADLIASVGTLRSVLRLASNEPIELRGSLDLGPPRAADALDVGEQSIDHSGQFRIAVRRRCRRQRCCGRGATLRGWLANVPQHQPARDHCDCGHQEGSVAVKASACKVQQNNQYDESNDCQHHVSAHSSLANEPLALQFSNGRRRRLVLLPYSVGRQSPRLIYGHHRGGEQHEHRCTRVTHQLKA